MPIAAYGGATASRKMPAVIRRITSDSAALRPARSAYSPNTMPPIGRMKNATPNVAVEQQRRVFAGGREEQLGDHDRHEAEHREVVPLERVADHGGRDRTPVQCTLGPARFR